MLRWTPPCSNAQGSGEQSRIIHSEKNVKQMVRLPDSYAKSQQKYPVLFFLQVTDEIVEEIGVLTRKLHKENGTPEMIVVGINVEDKLERII